MTKSINLIIGVVLFLVSCQGYSNRNPNSTVMHTVENKSFASVVWSKDNVMTFIDENTSTLISAPNRIIALGIQPHSIYAFDSLSGEVIWTQDVNGKIPNTMAINKDILYTSNLNTIQAFETMSGEKIWDVVTPYSGIFSSMNVFEEQIFLYSSNGSFFTLSTSGKIVESKGPNYYPAPLIVKDDITYAGNAYGIIAFETSTNREIWQARINPPFYTAPAFLKSNIYIRTGSSVIPGSVYSINMNNGIILWQNDIKAISNLAFLGDKLYVLSLDGNLLALSATTGLVTEKIQFSPAPFVLPTAEWRLGGYYVTADTEHNMIVVSTGDSYQLFALKINNP